MLTVFRVLFAGVNEPSASRDLLLSLLGCCGVIISKEEFPLLVHTRTFHTLKARYRSFACCACLLAVFICASVLV